MKTKILSLVLVVAMLASMLVLAPVSGATESKATLEFGNTVGVQGDTVTVDFKVTTEALTGLQFGFEYDVSRLEFVSAKNAAPEEYNVMVKEMTTGTAYKPYTDYAPYRVYTWAEVDNAVLNIRSETLLSLTFNIKTDAPIGDAYVKVADVSGDLNKISAAGVSVTSEQMTFIDGSVTVLPAGYSTESTLTVHTITQEEFDKGDDYIQYTYNEDYTGIIITKYVPKHDGAVLILPDYLDDSNREREDADNVWDVLPVVGIAPKAFQARKELAVVIPETVTNIASAAFFNSTISDYYVLNPDCEIGLAAFGGYGTCSADGVWTGTEAKGPWVKLLDATTLAVPTVHGAVGSDAEASTTGFFQKSGNGITTLNFSTDMTLPAEYTMTFDGTKYYFLPGTEVTLPGMMEDENGRLVVAWTDGTNTYAPGQKMALTGDVELTVAKTIAKPSVQLANSFKVAEDEDGTYVAMRFTTEFAIADYETLAELGDVTMGTIITPARYVSLAGGLTKEALDTLGASNGAYVDIDTTGKYFDKTGTHYIFAGSLKNIKAANVSRDFAAAFYLTVETASGSFTVYSDFVFANNKKPLDTAIDVYENGNPSGAQATALLDFIQTYKQDYVAPGAN